MHMRGPFTIFTSLVLFSVLSACVPLKPAGLSTDSADSSMELSPCELNEKSQFDPASAQQMQWYQSHGFPLPSATDRSQLVRGTNGRAVVVVQGFASSPAPLGPLIAGLNAAGFTVIAPLMTGFSSSPD